MRNNQEHYSINTRLYKSRMEAFCRRAGVILNINKPATIQDKLAWLNIYDEDMKKVKFADKVECKNFAGFYLKNWDIMSSWCVCNCIFDITACSITNLLLEIIQTKAEQSM